MPPNAKHWTEVTTSEFAHERAALHFIRERFPAREPFRAWANFTFIADDGTRNEVDLLVVSPTGVYLVEIKSHPGRMDGDAGTWIWTSPEGRRKTLDNPLILTERKAKKLKSLLMRQRPLKDSRFRGRGFFLKAVVFLSDANLVVGLNEPGRTDVYGPDATPQTSDQANQLPGLINLFARVNPGRGRQVDRPLSSAIAQAMNDAGIRESTTHRRVGIYELGDLIGEGEGWQDFASVHPEMKETHRRLRIYLVGSTHDEEERQALGRAAEREFKFLQGVDHPGIEAPIELLQNPRGPVLVFRRDPESQRLDHWLADHGEDLNLLDRIELVRQIAEAVRHAHRQGLYHRALAPQHISVSVRHGETVLRIGDWQTAARQLSTTMSPATGTAHVVDRVIEQAHIYLAPETLSVPNPQPTPADIWSLGAVAFLVLTGKPPAPDVDGLHERLREHGSLTLASAMDAAPYDLDEIIRAATRVDASERFVSVDEFLEFLDNALAQLTAPDHRDPLEASKGDEIDGTWTVVRRVGSGRTSVVLLAQRGRQSEILKIARSEEHGQRLKAEYEILKALRDRSIIEPYGLEEIGGRTVLRLEPALSTLGEAIRKDGALSLDLLERYGNDLLGAVAHLDDEGVAHRDIKPDNIGIAERGKDKERHLVLFDFSLSREEPSEIRVGTVGYLDPFLEEREPRRWDDQAERYAIAVTLYEMATGKRPEWGDGSTDPVLTTLQEPTIEIDLLDPAVREDLSTFFRQALQRRPEGRFDTIGEMRRSWGRIFSTTEHGGLDESAVSAADVDLSEITAGTPIAELPLAAKVRNAVERLGATTAEELATIPPAELVRLAGIGATTRKEVKHLAQRLREELAGASGTSNPDAASIDRIAEQLVPKPPADEDHRTAVASILELTEDPHNRWPSVRQTVDDTTLERSTVSSALSSGRTRWKKRSDVTAVRKQVTEILTRRGGISGADEVAGLLLTARGSLASEPIRSRRARAVLRAAIEAEAALQEPRFLGRRLGRAFLVVLDGAVQQAAGTTTWDSDRLTDAAAALGDAAQDLAERTPLLSTEQVARELRSVPLPNGVGPFSDARLVRLAAAAAETVAVSTRLELYPAGIDPAAAIRESRALLLDRNGLEPSEIERRVRARFLDAAPLPERPALDKLLEPLGLEWRDGRYRLPTRGGLLSTMVSSRTRTTTFASADDRAVALRHLDARLEAMGESGGFLALTVDKRRFREAAAALVRTVGGTYMDLDRKLIDVMRSKSDDLGANWEILLKADNQRGQRPWTHLTRLVDRALPDVEAALLGTPGIVVLTGIGLLVRYERSSLLERLRDTLTRGAAGQGLRGLVLVVPGSDPSARPVIDGTAVPVITANQWAHLPSAWLTQHSEGTAA